MTSDSVRAAYARAFDRAAAGFDWGYPCLVWVADFVRDATGEDPIPNLRGTAWGKRSAIEALVKLAYGVPGASIVGRGIARTASIQGWPPGFAGDVLVGVYDARGHNGHGAPAIKVAGRDWLRMARHGAAVSPDEPDRAWAIA